MDADGSDSSSEGGEGREEEHCRCEEMSCVAKSRTKGGLYTAEGEMN